MLTPTGPDSDSDTLIQGLRDPNIIDLIESTNLLELEISFSMNQKSEHKKGKFVVLASRYM